MTDRTGNQKGAQQHPEGGHGDVTREALREERESGNRDAGRDASGRSARADEHGGAPRSAEEHTGRHRLSEDRQQHDEADKNSEKNRLAREGHRARGATNTAATQGGTTDRDATDRDAPDLNS